MTAARNSANAPARRGSVHDALRPLSELAEDPDSARDRRTQLGERLGQARQRPGGVEATQRAASSTLTCNFAARTARIITYCNNVDTLRISPYARLSYTEFGPDAPGIRRQLADATKIIELRGATPTEPYEDPDISAYQPKVTRPDFERWLTDFKEGRTDGIAGWDLDRIVRKPSDLERMIEAYDEAAAQGRRTAFITVQGSIDISTPDGRTMARVLVAFANKASMDTARRVARDRLDRAMRGRVWSNWQAFGWNPDGTLNSKSLLLKQAIEDLLDGINLPTTAVRWQEEGHKTERDKAWTSYTLKRMLISPRIAGLAFYKGEPLKDEDGNYIRGDWEALVDVETWQTVRDILTPKPKGPARSRKGLLSGLARCGLCGTGMVRNARSRGFTYGCRSKDSGGCARVSINGPRLDEQIIELMLTYLDGREIQPDAQPFEGAERLAELGSKKLELMMEYTSGTLSGELVFPAVRKIEEEEQVLRRAFTTHQTSQRRLTTTREEWPGLPLGRQQAIARELFEAIVIAPSGRTGRYDPDRVTTIWRST